MLSKQLKEKVQKIAEEVLHDDDLPETDPLDIADLIMDEVLLECKIGKDSESRLADLVLKYVKQKLYGY